MAERERENEQTQSTSTDGGDNVCEIIRHITALATPRLPYAAVGACTGWTIGIAPRNADFLPSQQSGHPTTINGAPKVLGRPVVHKRQNGMLLLPNATYPTLPYHAMPIDQQFGQGGRVRGCMTGETRRERGGEGRRGGEIEGGCSDVVVYLGDNCALRDLSLAIL